MRALAALCAALVLSGCVSVQFETPTHSPAAVYKAVFDGVQGCMLSHGWIKHSYPMPYVRVVETDRVPMGFWGYTDFSSGVIQLSGEHEDWLAHELIHYLLAAEGLDSASNTNHNHPAFESECELDYR